MRQETRDSGQSEKKQIFQLIRSLLLEGRGRL